MSLSRIVLSLTLAASCQACFAEGVMSLLAQNPAKDQISEYSNVSSILKEDENAADSSEKKCDFHIKKCLVLRSLGKKKEALKELEIAESRLREAAKPDWQTLYCLAAANDVCGNAEQAKRMFSDAGASALGAVKDRHKVGEGLFELAAYSPVLFNSYALSQSLAQESVRELEQNGEGNSVLAGQALTLLGAIQNKSGDGKHAIDTLLKAERVLAAKKNSSELEKAQLELSRAYVGANRSADAINELQQMQLEDHPNDSLTRETIQAAGLLCTTYQKAGKKKDAEKIREKWKAKLKEEPELYVSFLHELGEAASNQGDYVKSAHYTNEAEDLHNRIDKEKTAVNDLIKHFYVLKSCCLYGQAARVLTLENNLRRLEEPSAPDRVPIKGPADGTTDVPIELSAEKKAELTLSKTNIAASIGAYRKVLSGDPRLSRKLQQLEKYLKDSQALD